MATVLIVDDMESVRHLLRLTLNRRHTVIEAEDGAEALDVLRRHHPDVVILDVTMPILTGVQLCRLLRADPDLRAIGVIIMSGNADGDEAHQAGADHCISKPFRPSDVLAAVDNLVQSRVRIERLPLT